MALEDPGERERTGIRQQSELTGVPAAEPATLLQSAWRDFIFAEVWVRPRLDRRSRYLISLSGAACEGGCPDVIDNYVRGALTTGELSLLEVREAALHLAVYAGWSSGEALDASISRVEKELDLAPVDISPLQGEPREPEQRIAAGRANFEAVMHFPSPPPVTPYFEGGILNFVFGEVWNRPGLDERSRRWVTMVGVANSSSRTPIRTHTYAAMKSGNASPEEMQEFVLQYAIHGGWPRASVMQAAVIDMAKLVAQGLPYED